MANVEVIVDLGRGVSVRQERVYCDICVRSDGLFFPNRQWNDLVLVIVVELLESLTRRRTARVHFMEGPFAIDLKDWSDSDVEVELVERAASETVVGGARTNVAVLRANIEAQVAPLLLELGRMGKMVPDAQRVEQLLRKLVDGSHTARRP